jgi:hypothetical protein
MNQGIGAVNQAQPGRERTDELKGDYDVEAPKSLAFWCQRFTIQFLVLGNVLTHVSEESPFSTLIDPGPDDRIYTGHIALQILGKIVVR